jgi:protein transport protein SEC31
MKARQVAWHPEVATQMCLSSDDDQSPYLQIWDLRFATSPVRVLEGHQR